MLKVLALATYPDLAAATRYRLCQFVEPLRLRGIDLQIRPMLDDATFAHLYARRHAGRAAAGIGLGMARRIGDLMRAHESDMVLVQREAFMVGPPLVEWLINHVLDQPFVLDLDDPTWVAYDSPTYGRVGRWAKWPGKGDRLIRMAAAVTCGNEIIRDHVMAMGQPATVIPPVVDPNRFRPRPRPSKGGSVPVIGWVGSHSTQPYVEALFPVLEDVARRHEFRLRLIGVDGVRAPPTIDLEARPWALDREVSDFQGFDIGLYPLPTDDWAMGKAGLKAVQYMAVGRPYVVSGGVAAADLGVPGTTHLVAANPAEWSDHLGRLLDDRVMGARMGDAGRQHVLQHLTIEHAADALSRVLSRASEDRA